MADISRLRKSRSANRNVVKGLIVKARDAVNTSNFDQVEVILRTIENKRKIIVDLDSKILDVIEEKDIDEDVDATTNFELSLDEDIFKIRKSLVPDKDVDKREEKVKVDLPDDVVKPKSTGVNLPKIAIKRFNGDATLWCQFFDTFEATIHKNPALSDVEKFSYLKGYLGGAAERCIDGLLLTNSNYGVALNLLKERYANPQLIIASHMNKLLKMEKVRTAKSSKELRNFYDRIESHVRSLQAVGVNPGHYGPLLIPIILDRVPDDIKLMISRKLGTSNWEIDAMMNLLKEEIMARESCDYLNKDLREEGESDFNRMTTDALYTGIKVLICAFCGQNHYHDRCQVITDVSERRKIVNEKRLCYRCLSSNKHRLSTCRSKRKCYRCQSDSHHTAVCTKNEEKEGENPKKHEIQSYLVSSQTSVLLQTTSAIAADTRERKKCTINVLFDTGSQRTFLSERLVRKLNLSPYSSREMVVKAFGDTKGKASVFNEYKFCITKKTGGEKIYLAGFAVKSICSPLAEQKIKLVEDQYPMIKSLELGDCTQCDGDIDLLIGADYYGVIVGNETRSFGEDGLKAISSKLGWLLFGPYKNPYYEEASCHQITATNLVEVTSCLGTETDDHHLSEEVEKLWSMEALGIADKENSWFDKCVQGFRFTEGRYEVNLPFKENRRFMDDNYMLAKRRLVSLKKKLDKDPALLKKYDEIIKNQLEEGIVENANSKPSVGEVTYSPHRAVIRGERATSKVRIVYDLSAKRHYCLMFYYVFVSIILP